MLLLPNDKDDHQRHAFILCDCQSEGLLITDYDVDPDSADISDLEIYVSLYSFGQVKPKISLRERITYAWRYLTKGAFYSDQLVIRADRAIQLGEYLKKVGEEKVEIGKKVAERYEKENK